MLWGKMRFSPGAEPTVSWCASRRWIGFAEAFAARIHEEFADSPVATSGRSIEVRVCIGGAVSHVDKMIKKLPGIAMAMAEGISHRPGFSSITEVDQFYERDRSR